MKLHPPGNRCCRNLTTVVVVLVAIATVIVTVTAAACIIVIIIILNYSFFLKSRGCSQYFQQYTKRHLINIQNLCFVNLRLAE